MAVLGFIGSVTIGQAADAVKLGGFWIENVRIMEITPDAILYASGTGQEVSRPLLELEGIKMSAYPALGQADDLLSQMQDGADNTKVMRQAVKALNAVRATAKERWLAHWVGLRAMQLEQQLGDNVAAARSFLQLAQTDADLAYLKQPPVNAYQSANADERRQIIDLYRGSLGRLSGAAKVVVGQVVTLLEKIDAQSPPPTSPTDSPTASPSTPASPASQETAPATGTPKAAASTNVLAPLVNAANAGQPEAAVLLPVGTPSNDPVAKLLREGKFDQARDMLNKTLNGSGARMSMRLYQLGVAQLAKAEDTKNESDYMDAGLSFARVLIYFPDTTAWVGPSMAELAYIHQKIGQPAKAADLYDNAINSLDEEEDPAYFARVQQLRETISNP